MGYLFDAAVAVILILCVIFSAKKGAFRTLISFGIHMVCFIVAFFLTAILGENIYYNYVQDGVISNIEESTVNFSISDELKEYYKNATVGITLSDRQAESILSDTENMDSRLAKAVNYSDSSYTAEDGRDALFSLLNENLQSRMTKNMPPCGNKFFDETGESKNEMFGLISMLDSDMKGAVKYIEEHCVRDRMIRFVKLVLFVIGSLVLIVIAKLVTSFVFRNDSSGASGTSDAVLGALTGLLVAAVICVSAAMLCRMLVYAGVTASFFSDEALDNTLIFRYLYNFDKLLIK